MHQKPGSCKDEFFTNCQLNTPVSSSCWTWSRQECTGFSSQLTKTYSHAILTENVFPNFSGEMDMIFCVCLFVVLLHLLQQKNYIFKKVVRDPNTCRGSQRHYMRCWWPSGRINVNFPLRRWIILFKDKLMSYLSSRVVLRAVIILRSHFRERSWQNSTMLLTCCS